MVQLRQFIGAIMTDITQARAFSDEFSRDLRSMYQQDPVLRLLPIPRTDIKEVIIDLKVAVVGARSASHSGISISLLDRITELIPIALLGAMRDQGLEESAQDQIMEALSRMLERLANTLSETGVEFTLSGLRSSRSQIRDVLLEVLMSMSEAPLAVLTESRGLEEAAIEIWQVIVARAIENVLDRVQSEIREESPVNGTEMDFEVITSQLTELPAEVISSISIKLDMNSL